MRKRAVLKYTVNTSSVKAEDGSHTVDAILVREHSVGRSAPGIGKVHQSDTEGVNADLISNVSSEVWINSDEPASIASKQIAAQHAVEHMTNLQLSCSMALLEAQTYREVLEILVSELESCRFEVLLRRDDTEHDQVMLVHASRGHLPLKRDHSEDAVCELPGDRAYITFMAKNVWSACMAAVHKAAQQHGLDAEDLLLKCRDARRDAKDV